MCGICGIVNSSNDTPISIEVLERMRDVLDHRGPDDAGMYINKYVGLAMRRLSIIDLERGHQPIHNEDNTVWIVFNGEIYNFLELRQSLEEKGHCFYTNSDTEVIVHLYEDRGEDCVRELNGMFAFAVWDERKKRLFLARDRLGIKPLHYASTKEGLIFASELKSILQYSSIRAEIDPISISEYFTFEYVPAPRTAFKDIYKIPPGFWLSFQDKKSRLARYWDIHFETDNTYRNESTWCDEIIHRFREAVKLQLRSDVPLGVLLSGGMDSSSVVAMMRQLGCERIDTFSIGFDEKDYNELNAARTVANYFDTNHRDLLLTADEVSDLVPCLIGFLDEPLADASIIPTYLVCRLARQHVKVAFSGDGGDELFGGYNTYQAHKVAKYYRSLPLFLREAIGNMVSRMPIGSHDRCFQFRARKFTAGVNYPPEIANYVWWGAYTLAQKKELFSKPFLKETENSDPFRTIHENGKRFGNCDGLNRIFYLDLKIYLQDDLLVKVDRMSMANSLEVRVPFLDHTFAEFAATIPSYLKIKGLRTKHILRKAMANYLPNAILRRGKRGFDIPLDSWIRGPLREFVLDVLSERRLREVGCFQVNYIKKLISEHIAGLKNHRQLLWPIVMFEFWRQRWC